MAAAPPTYDIRDAIRTVVDGDELSLEQSTAAMDAIMSGGVAGSQIAALATALRMKGETVAEITGFARAMRDHALHVEADSIDVPLLDTCGTGGDHSNSFNISTTATFVIAAAGIRIAKHGNRAASSICGSADLLEGLGVQVELSPGDVVRCIDEVGVGFMFAPAFHPALRFVGPTRREIGIRTIFNLLGPLTNPAGAGHQLIGVGHAGVARKLAEVLALLGSRRAVLVHSDEGLDEIGVSGATAVTEWNHGTGVIREYAVTPDEFGLPRGSADDLRGGNVVDNVAITRSILAGEAGPRRTVTLMNAGAGIYAAEGATSIGEGIALAAKVIDSGLALAKMEQLVAVTNRLVSARERVTA